MTHSHIRAQKYTIKTWKLTQSHCAHYLPTFLGKNNYLSTNSSIELTVRSFTLGIFRPG